MKLIDKDALVAEIEKRIEVYKAMKVDSSYYEGMIAALEFLRDEFINTIEVKEVDVEKYYHEFLQNEWFGKNCNRSISEMMAFTAKHFFELGLKASDKSYNAWFEVDSINHPNADKNKMYCVQTKGKTLLAKVITHPNDEELLQWKCVEFPNHRYDMCEGDKYMQIV